MTEKILLFFFKKSINAVSINKMSTICASPDSKAYHGNNMKTP